MFRPRLISSGLFGIAQCSNNYVRRSILEPPSSKSFCGRPNSLPRSIPTWIRKNFPRRVEDKRKGKTPQFLRNRNTRPSPTSQNFRTCFGHYPPLVLRFCSPNFRFLWTWPVWSIRRIKRLPRIPFGNVDVRGNLTPSNAPVHVASTKGGLIHLAKGTFSVPGSTVAILSGVTTAGLSTYTFRWSD